MQSRRILFVGHEVADEFAHRALEERGFKVTVAQNHERGYRQLLQSQFDLVVVNLKSPTEGIDFIKRVRETEITKRILMLAVGDWGTGQPTLALTKGADAYEPPQNGEGLAISIESLLTGRAVAAGGNK